jgi:hypothetical protein
MAVAFYNLASGGIYKFSIQPIVDSLPKIRLIGGTTHPFGLTSTANSRIVGDLDVGNSAESEIRCTGDIIAFSTSDITKKINIKQIEHPIDKIRKLSGNTFTWGDNASPTKVGKHDVGVIAQEVRDVLPEIVREVDNTLSVRYEKLIPLLIEGIKEQQSQIDELKRKVEGKLCQCQG